MEGITVTVEGRLRCGTKGEVLCPRNDVACFLKRSLEGIKSLTLLRFPLHTWLSLSGGTGRKHFWRIEEEVKTVRVVGSTQVRHN
jgi:hypothetical protein